MAAKRLHAWASAAGIDVRDLVPVWSDFNEDLHELGPEKLQTYLTEQLARRDKLRFVQTDGIADTIVNLR
jgi:hypothetical protein